MPENGPDPIEQLSASLEGSVAAAAAATVRVDARRRLPASGIVWEPHVVVTAAHVVEREDDILIGLPSGEETPATLAGRDDGSDIAVLRVPDVELSPPEWIDDVAVGRLVLALARPGPDPEAALGIIRAVGGSWRARGGGVPVEGYLRSDATMYPGFSGGPLADGSGRLLGMNTSRYAADDGFTVPHAAARPIVEALLRDGRIRPAYIGVASQAVRLSAEATDELEGQETGLLVVGVEPGTPAAEAGALQGDVIVRIEGHPIQGTDDLMAELLPGRIGAALTVEVVRGGALREVQVTPVERPPSEPSAEGGAPRHRRRFRHG